MTRIKTRYGTLSAWLTANPVLLAGERGEESDTGRAKIGDGETAWADLDYLPTWNDVALTGTPTAPTTDNAVANNQIATTLFVHALLSDKAPINSPIFTGTPTVPTPPLSVDSGDDRVVTRQYIEDRMSTLYDTLRAQWLLDAYPVGSFLITDSGTNPGDTYIGGTWVSEGAGRVLIGYDGSDPDFDTVTETGGSKTKNLAHTHTMSHNHGISGESYPTGIAVASGSGTNVVSKGAYDGHNHGGTTGGTSSANTGSAGSATQDILPPYRVVHMWRRTA